MPVGKETRRGKRSVIEVTFSLDTDTYADGDVLTDTQEIEGAIKAVEGTGIIDTVVVFDKDDQGEAMDLVFFRNDVSLGPKNAPVRMSDADAAQILGVIGVAVADYVDLVNSQIVTKTNVGILAQGEDMATSLYVSAISRGTGTYTPNGIMLKIGILQD